MLINNIKFDECKFKSGWPHPLVPPQVEKPAWYSPLCLLHLRSQVSDHEPDRIPVSDSLFVTLPFSTLQFDLLPARFRVEVSAVVQDSTVDMVSRRGDLHS